tara:strand:+ start:118 stop:819 length:702 start_codon:yes stop_codon:yes gene_type:complete
MPKQTFKLPLGRLKTRFFTVISIFRSGGVSLLLYKIKEYLSSNFIKKWEYVYFEADLDKQYRFPKQYDSSVSVKIAKTSDIKTIKEDIFPYMTELELNDRRELLEIGKDEMICFLAEQNEKLVHYTMIYLDPFKSPLMMTPFDQNLITPDHVYLSSAFTVDSVRGSWIHLQVLDYILIFLKRETTLKKTINLVHPDTLGSIEYFNRLGFKVIYSNSIPFYIRFIWLLIGHKRR